MNPLKIVVLIMFKLEINCWFHALARFCDYSVLFLILGAVTLFLPYFYGPFFYYFLAAIVPFLFAPLEGLLMSKWGTTPGKALFGLSVDLPVSYSEALCFSLFIPAKKAVMKQRPLSWRRKFYGFLISAAFVIAAVYGNVLALWTVGLEREYRQRDGCSTPLKMLDSKSRSQPTLNQSRKNL